MTRFLWYLRGLVVAWRVQRMGYPMCDNEGDVPPNGIAHGGRESHIISAGPAVPAIPGARRAACVHRGIDR